MRAEEIIGKEETQKLRHRIRTFVSQYPGSAMTAINQKIVKDINLNNLTIADLNYLDPLLSREARKLKARYE